MILFNPGAGAVEGGSFEQAHENIKQLIKDCEIKMTLISMETTPDEGRYHFILQDPLGDRYDVEMPGLPLECVRYMGLENQNPFDFPRLYVEGSSWLWEIVVDYIFSKKGLKEALKDRICEIEDELEKLKSRLERLNEA